MKKTAKEIATSVAISSAVNGVADGLISLATKKDVKEAAKEAAIGATGGAIGKGSAEAYRHFAKFPQSKTALAIQIGASVATSKILKKKEDKSNIKEYKKEGR